MIRKSFGWAAPALVAVLTAAACSSSEAPMPAVGVSSNATAAAQFNHMGDSVIAAGGTAADAAPFYGAAGVVGQAPNIATITVNIDGTSTSMNAVAVAVEIFGGPMIACPVSPVADGNATPFECPWGIPRVTRTLFAWTPAKPTQIVTLVASSDSGSIGTPVPVMFPGSARPMGVGTASGTMVDSTTAVDSAIARPIPAHFEYHDGHHEWWGVSGTQSNTVTETGAACGPPPTDSSSAPRPAAIPVSKCQIADFTFAFSGKVADPPIAVFGNTSASTATHAVSMSLTSITGVYFKLMTAALIGPR